MRSTAVKIPQLWTSPLDRDVSTTKLCFQNISILLGPAGDSGGNQAAASGFLFFFLLLYVAASSCGIEEGEKVEAAQQP